MKHLMETFRIEADEHLKAMALLLVALEKAKNPLEETEKVETVFREAHSLKGAARAVNLKEIEQLCQGLESVLTLMKRKTLALTGNVFDLLQETVDFLALRLQNAQQEPSQEEKDTEAALLHRLGLVKLSAEPESAEAPTVMEPEPVLPHPADASPMPLEAPENEEAAAGSAEIHPPNLADDAEPVHSEMPAAAPEGAAVPETLRVSSARLASVLLQSEEMLSAKLSSAQRVREIKGIASTYPSWKKEWSKISPAVQELRMMAQSDAAVWAADGCADRLRAVSRVMEFIDWNCEFIKHTEAAVRELYKTAERESLILEGMVNTLLEDMKKVTMFPFSSLLEMFPKVVRDLSKDHGRMADLEIVGSEIEIDRRILDEMRDPLIHLIRNCIDHGIEKPEIRKKKGKHETGRITISVAPRDHQVELVIADDGAGISADKVRAVLQKTGALSRERLGSLSDQELIAYVFHSGVSTSPIITELSGRGLGLAIVREKVEKLGGSITLETQPDAGTTFRIVLPLTIATFRGILISAGDQEYVLPTMYVERVMRIRPESVQTVENRETILVKGCPVSLVRLSAVLGQPGGGAFKDTYLQVVVLAVSNLRMAFLVECVQHEQEVLFKSLGPQLSRVRNIAGATVLGTGRAVPILNVPDLMKSAVRASGSPMSSAALAGMHGAENTVPSVLVAEDSITTRTLLKNILETAGYSVQTAIDGLDALTKLKNGQYDIVLSDVDMPRMNGFDLTDRIRKNGSTKDLPVILITALESREDQERGIDVGASAYIVKSMFDQSNLLNVMERLILREVNS